MKLPSINYLITNAKDSFKRFPLTIVSSFIAAILGIYLIENGNSITNKFPYINLILCLGVGIPLYFCVTIISNKIGFDKRKNLIFNSLATIILVIIYFTLPNIEETHNTSLPYIKYTIYNLTCHLLVSFIPFAFSKQLNAFWHYNKILFIRILTSILYSGFIYIGLIIALTSLHLLFDIKIHEKLYFEIWVVTMCFFNTWFFVGGIPVDFDQLDNIYEYPNGLKIFSQYVLIPLLGLYLIILYAYGTKILIFWDWPKGIVSYLIICVSVLGILAFLLLHPYGYKKENLWIKKVSKGYYILLIPLLIILFIAIFMRLNDYGITINRYIILALGIWLTIVCFYTVIGKANIKFIPTSLAVLLILISFGPWGMFSVSEKSQVKRLKNILEQSKIVIGNKVQNEPTWIKDSLPNLQSHSQSKNTGRLTDSLHNEVLSILNYLDDHHGFSSIRNLYKQDIDSIVNLQSAKKNNSNDYSEAEIYMKTLGLKYEHKNLKDKELIFEYKAEFNESLSVVKGYDYLIDFNIYNPEKDKDNNICSFKIDSTDYDFFYLNTSKIRLSLKSKNDKIDFELEDLINELRTKFGNKPVSEIPISNMRLVKSNNKFEFKIEIHSINVESGNNKLHITDLSGEIFIKTK